MGSFWSKAGKIALGAGLGAVTGGWGGALVGGASALFGANSSKPKKDPYQPQIDETLATDKARDTEAYDSYKGSRDAYAQGIDRMEGYDATETRGLTSAQGGFKPTRTDSATSSVTGFTPSNVQGLDPETLAALKAGNVQKSGAKELTTELERARAAGNVPLQGAGMVDTSSLRNFDPTAAVNQYAQGAWGLTQSGLTDQLRALRQDAAGRHRINTGWFDEDQGRVVRDVTSNFTNQLATKAVDAAGLYVDAQGRAINAETQRLGDMDQFTLGAGKLAVDERGQLLDAAGKADDLNLDRAKYLDTFGKDVAFDAYGERAKRAGALDDYEMARRKGTDDFTKWQAETGDTLGLKAAAGTDDFNLSRAKTIDEGKWNAVKGATDARGHLYDRESEMSGSASDRYHDWLSGASDRATGRQNQAQQNEQNWWQTGIGALGTLGSMLRKKPQARGTSF